MREVQGTGGSGAARDEAERREAGHEARLLVTHSGEIEKRTTDGIVERRVSCSCGFLGPWRRGRSTAYSDREDHETRMAYRSGAKEWSRR